MNQRGPLMMDLAGTALDDGDRRLLAHPLVGGVILFTRNYRDREQLAALCAQIRAVDPELLIVVDYEGGRVQRFRDGFTRLPPMATLGALHAEDAAAARAAATDLGWLMAAELAECDIDMPLAPVVDLDYGRASVIGDRAFAADAATVAELAGALQAGLHEGGMASTAKHFPGHGAVSEDSHLELPVDTRLRAELEADIAPYRTLLDQGLDSIMMAHIRYPGVDPAPASLSGRWIGDILRGELGFAGAIFCDDLSMGGAAAVGDYPERARQALNAGCDILPVCNNRDAVQALLASLAVPDDAAAANRRAALRRRAVAAPDPGRLDQARELATRLAGRANAMRA